MHIYEQQPLSGWSNSHDAVHHLSVHYDTPVPDITDVYNAISAGH